MIAAETPRDARDMTDQEYRVAVADICRVDYAARSAAESERNMARLRLKYPDLAARADAARREV